MMKCNNNLVLGLALGALALPQQAWAEKTAPVVLAHCSASLGTIALVDGDQAGWTKYGLGSPRELLNAMALESGCFTPRSGVGNEPVRFLVTAIAGDKEEVDKGIEMAKSAAVQGLVRSGAASSMLGRVPLAGGMMGMFGGLGGKKKTIAAGLRVVSPNNGLTIASGTGSVTKSSLTFGGSGGWAAGAAASGYGTTKDGQQLAEAFMIAFNTLVGQSAVIAASAQAAPVAAPASAMATVAVATSLRSAPSAKSALVRALRAGTTLTPTGKREGLFVELTDNFGTRGWVSVEDLK